MTPRKIRYGMIGGGEGAFIGAVHRMAANLDGELELRAGVFSSNLEKSQRSGEALRLPPARVYATYEEMAAREAALSEGERIDFVSIVTPNNSHASIATRFLEAGFHVMCEKPMTYTLAEAKALVQTVRKTGKHFGLMHSYTGYPMVKLAREMVAHGELGKILKIVAEYPQGWLLESMRGGNGTLSGWRANPELAGASCCLGDIGTHAEHLGRYITGLEIETLCAQFNAMVPGHELEDDANLLLRYKGGAVGVLWASQIACGEENNLNIRVYGEEGSLVWFQEHPNELHHTPRGQPRRTLRRGNNYVSEKIQKFTRLPFGHPEALIESFANIYLEFARAVRDHLEGKTVPRDFPNAEDGLIGMAFLESALQSARSEAKWTPFVQA